MPSLEDCSVGEKERELVTVIQQESNENEYNKSNRLDMPGRRKGYQETEDICFGKFKRAPFGHHLN